MNAIILAAGFGTRLKPWTDHNPKALVPVAGVPVLERVLIRLESQGFDNIVINAHHFADRIKEFIDNYDSSLNIKISDEKEKILDTGGGVLHAAKLIDNDRPILIHNVDILSDAPLRDLYETHKTTDRNITLITSRRDSIRKLLFDNLGNLIAWHDTKNDVYKPINFRMATVTQEHAFSGIYIIDRQAIKTMHEYSAEIQNDAFPIIDYFLWAKDKIKIGEMLLKKLHLIDIGKPNTLAGAEDFISRIYCDAQEL